MECSNNSCKCNQSMSDSNDKIFKAISAFGIEVKNPKKDKFNPFHKNRYSDLSTIIDGTKTLLSKNGLSVIQICENINDKTFLVTLLAHESGQWIKSFYPLIAEKNTPQSYGTAMTYARRYNLSAILGIASDDDNDGNSDLQSSKPSDSSSNTTRSNINKITSNVSRIIGSKDILKIKEYLTNNYSISTFEGISREKINSCLLSLQNIDEKKGGLR